MSDNYWNTFMATVSFMEPVEIVGTLEWLDTVKTASGSAPKMCIRLDNGQGVIINATQARLLEELTRHRPAVGDRIKIIYSGEAPKAPPGMNPTKQFEVKVHRAKETAS